MNIKKVLLASTRSQKKLLVILSDLAALSFSIFLIAKLSGYNLFIPSFVEFLRFIWHLSLSLMVFWLCGVYDTVVRYINLTVIFVLARAILIFSLLSFISELVYNNFLSVFSSKSLLIIDLQGWLIGIFSFTFLILSTRLVANYYLSDRKSEKKVVIYGAGSAGIQLASALRVSKEMQPIAFIDQNKSLHGTYLGGIKVLAPKNLKKLNARGKVDEVLIAMPSASKSVLRSLLKEIEKFSIKVRILPGLAELAQGKILVSELKEVDISDLLGRYEVEAKQDLINQNIQDKVVLITGAGGSIGSEISRQVVKNKPSKVILIDSNEYALYSIKKELEGFGLEAELFAILASVTNKKRIKEVCKTFKVNTIYHTAAYKHVPMVEENPFEAVINNIHGTKSCAEAAMETKVDTFVLISTDKAVRPTNIMGATKRFSELFLQSISSKDMTRMIMVRFGNVLGSSGSAIPLFQQQIKEGGPVTVTHPEVIRYFMSIPEAAELVIQAGAMGKGGDVFVLDMGEPVKIYELARRLINLSGMEVKDKDNPEGDIEIIFTGLRPGEKLYEELLIGDNVSTTEHRQILRAEEEFFPPSQVNKFLESLKEAEDKGDVQALTEILQEAVVGFKPSKKIVDLVYQQKNNFD